MVRSHLTLFALASLVLFLSGCVAGAGAMRSYDTEMKQAQDSLTTKDIPKALADHEKNNSGDKDLLYFLEKGILLRLNNQYADSRDAWLQADEKVRIWEEEAKLNPDKILSYIGTAIINDKVLRYDGQDFEKVMLSTNLAIDHILLGDLDKARTEIKKMHEREAIIAEIRSKEVEKIEEEAKKRNVKTEFKDLQGYPVETLNDPEVTKLKNSYQSAFGHYLAGFVYEALNEPSLAAPGYRKAIELRPGIKILEEGLRNLDRRTGIRTGKAPLTDVLFVVETGMAPARESVSIQLPVPTGNTLIPIPISFPVIKAVEVKSPTAVVLDNGKRLPLSSITDINTMSRRALKDDMPGIILRSTIRAITKSVAQDQAQRRGGLVLGAVVTVAAVATESADERVWRTLPADISIARMQLPAGKHSLEINGSKLEIDIQGRYAVVPIRIIGPATYLAQPFAPKDGGVQLPAIDPSTVEAADPPARQKASTTKTSVKKTKTSVKKTKTSVKKTKTSVKKTK